MILKKRRITKKKDDKGNETKEYEETQFKDKDAVSQTASAFSFKKDGDGDIDGSTSMESNNDILSKALAGLGNALKFAADNALILDYIFENFSYNTVVQDNIIEKEGIDGLDNLAGVGLADTKLKEKYNADKTKYLSKTMSGYKINSSHNYGYGAEIEYMLYGNSSPSKNITSAKARIYALRFAFDAVYAFTNSEVRNIARTAGLAVQAATLGIVPYQLVMIVVQLAFAAGEAALDLSLIGSGVDVVIIKNTDTWMLSVSGGKNALEAAAKIAVDTVSDVAMDKVKDAIDSVSSGLQKVIDSGADELKSSAENLMNDMGTAAKGMMHDAVDSATNKVQTEIEAALNQLMYTDFDGYTFNETTGKVNPPEGPVKSPRAYIDEAFGKKDNNTGIYGAINSLSSDNEIIQQKAMPIIKQKMTEVVDKAYNELSSNIPSDGNVTEAIVDKISTVREQIADEMKKAGDDLIDGAQSQLTGATNELIDSAQGKINEYINQCSEDLSKEAADRIKEGITEHTNSFIDGISKNAGNEVPAQKQSSSTGTIIKFGYKEYLMMFMYIKLCTSSPEVLTRMSYCIENNVKKFGHKSGDSFSMDNAYSYINMNGKVKLNMLFLNLDFFKRMVRDDDNADEDLAPSTDLEYNSIMGY